MNDVQKAEALASTETQIEQSKSQFEIQRMQTENQLRLQIMAQQFEYDMKLKQIDVETNTKKEAQIEDRKDTRTKMQASQQSQMIAQRETGGAPTDFEQTQSDDNFDMQNFDPPA